ncbi:MAG: phosphosulfolactate synthase [bacterium]|nr:phosphosulfolactate synthase [bacterium]MDE0290291.1 phosphosulfolactate synthase [bacterium]MDE0440329.1 phosphosulfolactate synthase [bacterium]
MNPADRPGWYDLAVAEEVRTGRTGKPRARGITMVIDTGLGLSQTAELLDMAGQWIDHWKLSFGTSALVPEPVLRKKLELINSTGTLTFPGGTLFEAATAHRHCRHYMRAARRMGFTAVEISEGTFDLPPERRRRAIECGLSADLIVISEVGKKDPETQPEPEDLASQVLTDLEWGSSWVVMEGRESGTGVGVYDTAGHVDLEAVETVAARIGEANQRLVWEAPLKEQQTTLIDRFGMNVNLGNIAPERVLALEALRSGLRYETLRSVTARLEEQKILEIERPEPED